MSEQRNYWDPVDPFPVPLGPPAAVHYAASTPHAFYAAMSRRDGIPIGYCFCGHRRPWMGDNTSAWCKNCGILWTTSWGRLGWVDQERMNPWPQRELLRCL